MKVKQLGPNKTVITMPNEDEIFFSYETPVAGWICGKGYWRTTEKFSRTTSKHVSQYVNTYRVRDLTPDQTAELLDRYSV